MRSYEEFLECDFAFEVLGIVHLRVNAFNRCAGRVFRTVPSKALSMDELGIGETFRDIGETPRGLIRVMGPTGSCKSTTLAAIRDYEMPFAETGRLASPPWAQTSLTRPSSGLSTISRRTGCSSGWTVAEPGRYGGAASDRQATCRGHVPHMLGRYAQRAGDYVECAGDPYV